MILIRFVSIPLFCSLHRIASNNFLGKWPYFTLKYSKFRVIYKINSFEWSFIYIFTNIPPPPQPQILFCMYESDLEILFAHILTSLTGNLFQCTCVSYVVIETNQSISSALKFNWANVMRVFIILKLCVPYRISKPNAALLLGDQITANYLLCTILKHLCD